MIKQIRTSVEGEIRFEAEYDQGRGDWRDFQKEFYDSSDCKYFLSDVQSHHQSLNLRLCGIKCAVSDNDILFMVYDTKWYIIYINRISCTVNHIRNILQSKLLFFHDHTKIFDDDCWNFLIESYRQNTNFWPTYCTGNV